MGRPLVEFRSRRSNYTGATAHLSQRSLEATHFASDPLYTCYIVLAHELNNLHHFRTAVELDLRALYRKHETELRNRVIAAYEADLSEMVSTMKQLTKIISDLCDLMRDSPSQFHRANTAL